MPIRRTRPRRPHYVVPVPAPPVIRWYVVAIKATQYRKILEKLDDLNVEVFYPQRTVWRKQRKGPRIPKSFPLIASYVFVGCDLTRISARSILSINGVINFLGVEGVPGECDPDALAQMRQWESDGAYDETLARMHAMIIGHVVLVEEGPFTGFNGTITDIDGETATIDINVFGKSTPMKINIDKLGH